MSTPPETIPSALDQFARPRPVCLALQGGGSHGACAAGVPDALLRDGGLAVAGVSGASAGAINAAVLVQALDAGAGPRRWSASRRFGATWGDRLPLATTDMVYAADGSSCPAALARAYIAISTCRRCSSSDRRAYARSSVPDGRDLS